MYKYKFALVTLILSLIFPVISAYADTYPKREIRAAWVTVSWNNDWPTSSTATTATKKAEVETYLDLMKKNGFNAAFLHVRGMSDRIYKLNTYGNITINEPWSSYVSGTRGTDPGWDPLAYWIEQAHERGMELHAWINPYRFGNRVSNPAPTATNYPFNSTEGDKEAVSNGMIISYLNPTPNESTGYYTRYYIFNPALDAVKTRIKNICQVLTYNYDIDGIVFDDYFYPEGIGNEGTEAEDYTNYADYVKNGGTMNIGDWRRNNINDMVDQVYNAIKAIKPYVKFGISPAGAAYDGLLPEDDIPPMSDYCKADDWQYDGIFSDPMYWMRNKTVDYLSPQLYWKMDNSTNGFNEMATWWHIVASKFGRHYYASHTLSFITNATTSTTANFTEIQNQIEANRNTTIDNNLGTILFSLRNFSGKVASGLAPHLKEYTYQKRAIVPATDWYETTNPGKPQNLKLSSSTLTWDAATMSDGTVSGIGMRYAVYAIPLNIGRVDASSDVHTKDGGFKAEYLLDLTYSNTYSVSNYSSNNYWYAVTIVDRYGNEWEAATINEPALGNASISLNEPADNSTLEFTDNTFSWTSDGETFIFQISTSSDFSSTLLEQETTAKSITIASTNFTDGTTYYWRVQASRTGYNSAWSETRTFTMETRPTITLTLLTPAKGSTIDSETISFSWNGVEGANYTFELAEYSSFSNILITTTTTDTNHEIATSTLTGNKTYFWRIKATKENYQSAISEYSSFITPKVEGETVDGITIEKLWVKSKNEGNFPSQLSESCTNPRSMAAYQGDVYVLERTSATNCSLLVFDGDTGEYIKTIALTGDCLTTSSGSALGYPCNSIYIDGGGNLCVANMTTNSKTQPLTVCTVDISNGETSREFESSLTTTGYRIDYSNAFEDITADGGQIWAATASSDKVLRWTRTSSGWIMEETTISDFYPTTATTFGSAPSIQPISDNQFIVDGADTHPTLYTFNSGSSATLNSSFESNKSIEPKSPNFNGTYSITIGNTPLFIYANNNNHSFSIVANKENFDFSQFQFMQSVPENQFGSANNPFILDQPVAINNADGSVTVFLYAPNNGLAAYKLTLPKLATPTLTSPESGAKANDDEQTFSWEGVEGSSYTLYISANNSFTSIARQYTTDSKFYTVPMLGLNSSTTYYWRVSAKKSGYVDSEPSETWTFISPEKPTFARPELYAPADGKIIKGDISFVASQVTTAGNQYLEIATDAAFTDIVASYNDGVLTKAELTGRLWYQYTVPVSILRNTGYFWRVRAVDPDGLLDDGISETRIIYVLNDQDNYTDSYFMAREEDPDYGIKNNVRLTNNWIRSTTYVDDEGNSNDIAIGTGTASRGFCVRPDVNGDQDGKDIIYITYRDASKAYFYRFDAATGAKLDEEPALISGDVISSAYTNNGVFLDDELNICIYNMCLSSESGNTLQICTVTPETLVATEKFSTTITSQRFDHVRAIGDIGNRNFTLFGVAGSSSTIRRWIVLDGKIIDDNTMTASSSFGGNIMIYPVDDEYFFVDGTSTHFALYKWGTATPVGSFSSTNYVNRKQVNGGNYFIHNNKTYIIYSYTGYTTENYQFNIVSLPVNCFNANGFSEATSTIQYTFPQDENALPKTDQGGNSAWCALADYLPKKKASEELLTLSSTELQTRSINNSNTTILYTYVPGSGLASYSMTNHIVTGAEETDINTTPEITVKDCTIYFGTTVTEATLYSVSGQAIARVTDATDMYAPTQGVYILAIDINGIITAHKIIIK